MSAETVRGPGSSPVRYRLWIDEECIGVAQCVLTDPDLFALDNAGYGKVLVAEIGPEKLPAARTAVGNCPLGAVHLDEVE